MKLAIVSSLLLSVVAIAQDVQSRPFRLVVKSSDKSLNGQKLVACHTGAAIESLCLAGGSGSIFHLNTTKGDTPPIKGYTPTGTLTWNLPYENGVYLFISRLYVERSNTCSRQQDPISV